ncbi:MAG: hypothetical protein J6Q53_08825 [Oscillospiraceae bacterium]|nr:hypothetical protein [Oscillospiraceae bacterium]
MSLLIAEFKKILTKRFGVILLLAFGVNLLLFWHSQDSATMVFYEPEDYLAAQRDLLEVEAPERPAHVQQHYEMLEACRRWERYEARAESGRADPADIDDEMLQYQQVYESGEYLRYTDDLYAEINLTQALLLDVQRVQDHQARLEATIQDAKIKTTVSIFSKPGTFAYRSQLATIERFEGLTYIQPVYDVSAGVLNSQTSAVTDMIALLLILVLCSEMVISEQKNGMLPILRATRKGRLPLILSKVGSAFGLTLLVTMLLWGGNLLYCAGTTGFGDLSRPVQSLSGFTTCVLELSVGEYMLLFFLSKWLLYAAIGLLCLIVSLALQSAVVTWLTVGGFLSVEYILFQSIAPVSAWSVLRYVNVSGLIFSNHWLSEYRNVDFFGYPVEALTVGWVLTAALLVLGVLVLCLQFCCKVRTLPKAPKGLGWPKWLPRLGKSTALFGHEWWKLLIECGALLILVLFALLNLQQPRKVTYGSEELFYKNYMETLSGPLTHRQEEYLEDEAARFNGIRAELRQLQTDYADGKLLDIQYEVLSERLEDMLKPETVFLRRICPLIEDLKSQQAQGKDVWVVYEPGYTYLFGTAKNNDKADSVAMLLAALILCLANFYPLETTSGMQPLLNVYARGRGATARSKIAVGMIVTAVFYSIAQIPDYWYVFQNYGFVSLEAPICSLADFSVWSDAVSLLGGILIFEGLRLFAVLCVTMAVLLLGLCSRNQAVTLFAAAGVLLLPVLLHLLGITFLDRFSFLWPLTGTELMRQQPLGAYLLYYGVTAAVGLSCALILIWYTNRGGRFQKRSPA